NYSKGMSGKGPTRGKIIVFGIMFWYPLAGVTYQFLHYLIGLKRLGYDVYYIEDSGRWIYDPVKFEFSPDATRNISAVAPILENYGLAGRWAFRGNYEGGRCYGMSQEQILRLYREADAFLNVTASQELREEHMAIPRRIYVESDPFATQIKVAQGDEPTLAALDAHDIHFSYGENLGAPDCTVPVKRYQWLPTRQPVALDFWENPFPASSTAAYTTIATWRNRNKDIVWQGEKYYWTKDREFARFIDLPNRRPAKFELAVVVDAETERLLRSNGWSLVDSLPISTDVNKYRAYIQRSRGEFTVAKDQVVRPITGWFSDRSACFLAAGRPVITQETGFSKYLPTGKALFGFLTMDDILAAIDAIESDYLGASRVAREIAAEYFAAEKVLSSLMERAGL
ncbi:MAG TPA: hypothetical protein VIS99_06530, partial [Terrimicrobiaceae bacterium]